MTKKLPPLQRLPEFIQGNLIDLRQIMPESWPYVEALKIPDKRFLATQFVTAAAIAQIEGEITFIEPNSFLQLCDTLRKNQTRSSGDGPSRHYFMHAKSNGEIVGSISVHSPYRNMDMLAIGYATLRRHRGHGYATEAAQILSDTFLERGIAPVIYGEVLAGTRKSSHVLMRAGFQKTRTALCQTDEGELMKVRRFTKTPAPAKQHRPG